MVGLGETPFTGPLRRSRFPVRSGADMVRSNADAGASRSSMRCPKSCSATLQDVGLGSITRAPRRQRFSWTTDRVAGSPISAAVAAKWRTHSSAVHRREAMTASRNVRERESPRPADPRSGEEGSSKTGAPFLRPGRVPRVHIHGSRTPCTHRRWNRRQIDQRPDNDPATNLSRSAVTPARDTGTTTRPGTAGLGHRLAPTGRDDPRTTTRRPVNVPRRTLPTITWSTVS